MARQLLTDDLWNAIKGFFPQQPRSPRGDRPPIDNRIILSAILFVLRTGIAWADLPREMGCSYKICLRWLNEWTAAGVWQRVYLHLLRGLRLAGRLELAEVLVGAGSALGAAAAGDGGQGI